MAQRTKPRLDEIAARLGPETTSDTAYLKARHGYIFQDVSSKQATPKTDT